MKHNVTGSAVGWSHDEAVDISSDREIADQMVAMYLSAIKRASEPMDLCHLGNALHFWMTVRQETILEHRLEHEEDAEVDSDVGNG